MIRIENLTFGYEHTLPIFSGFNWQVIRGESWAILGPSGCGKSTLLSLIAGLLLPNSGTIRIDGQPLLRPRPHTGLIIQEYGLLPWATVRQNAQLGLRVRNFYGPDGTHAPRDMSPDTSHPAYNVDAWLERLGLLPVADQFPANISGGQRQRTAIARTLALQPDLLLMDEPFSSLDAPTREGLQRLTLELCSEQTLTLILVTHAIEEAATLGQKILLLNQPPNMKAVCVDNPGAAQLDYSDKPEFQAICRGLRERMNIA